VQSAPSSYANSLAVVNWKGKEASTVDEVAVRLPQYEESVSSSLVSAVEKPAREVRQIKENRSYSPPVRASISAIRGVSLLRREDTEATHHGAPCGFTCVTTERT